MSFRGRLVGMLVEDEKGKRGGLLLSPRATLMPISDLVDFEEDEGEGKGERQNVYSCECCVGVYVPIVIISRFFLSSY